MKNYKSGMAALAALEKSGYRKDLASAARSRFSKVYKSSRVQKGFQRGAKHATKRN